MSRKNFEISCLFPNNLQKVLPKEFPWFLSEDDGTYTSQSVEIAFIGYEMGVKSIEGKLKRFSPDRSLPHGVLTEIRDTLGNSDIKEEDIRNILKILGSVPT